MKKRSLKVILLKILLAIISIPILALAGIYLNSKLITFIASDSIYRNPGEIQQYDYALVMGAGNNEPELWINHSFDHRMEAVCLLYRDKKFEKIILSGIKVPGIYDETDEMKQELLGCGVPESNMILDTLGTRTWYSVLRTQKKFSIKKILIISQKGQLERAIFSAKCIGLDAVGFVAEPNPGNIEYWKVREYLARVKCIADCIAYQFKLS